MGGEQRPETGWEVLCDQAVGLLHRTLEWDMPEPRWALIDTALAAAESAFAQPGRPQEFDRALAELELLAPSRVSTGLGDPPLVPSPPEVRERVNKLIDWLIRPDEAADRPAEGAVDSRRLRRTAVPEA